METLILAFLTATPSVNAAFGGYSGILNVPSAQVRSNLALSFRWHEAARDDLLLSPQNTGTVNRTYVASLPLLPFLEVALGALSVSDWFDPGFPHFETGFHRASFVKVRLPIQWSGPDFALGAIDPIGANMLNGYDTKYGLTSYYAVATQRLGPLAITAGWGVGDRRLDNYARRQAFLDGPFGGLALGLPLGFELLAEWDALRPNGAIAWNGPFGISLLAGRIGSGWTAGASTALSL